MVFADLGETPIANDYLEAADLNRPEPRFPLRAFVCRSCRLVQLEDFVRADTVFRGDYAYQSSMSDSWLAHAEQYAAKMIAEYHLCPDHSVIEIASNDGYLLQYFKAAGIPVTGIEPAAMVAQIAREKRGIPTIEAFFGKAEANRLRGQIGAADIMVANNVLAHVPDINDFVMGFRILLKPEGVATFEFPHLLNLIQYGQFDTIYHEHFSYLSLLAFEHIFARAGLRVFDAEELATHGGSLRLYVCHHEAAFHETPTLQAIRDKEAEAELGTDRPYLDLAAKAQATKQALIALLSELKSQGKRIAAYGAPAKGNTLLNFCGIGTDLIEFTVDRALSKQGRYLPGSHIPILSPDAIMARKPDLVLILPWNLTKEISHNLSFIREWAGRFIVPIPTPQLLDESTHDH
jgi:SAM-dependent methyltransferase